MSDTFYYDLLERQGRRVFDADNLTHGSNERKDRIECDGGPYCQASPHIQELAASAEAAERELLVACNALYIATDAAVADDVKQKARAVIVAHTAFNKALTVRLTT